MNFNLKHQFGCKSDYFQLNIFNDFTVCLQAQLDKLNAEIALGAKRTGIEQASKLASIVPKICTSEDMKETPDIEWWDAYVYNQDE